MISFLKNKQQVFHINHHVIHVYGVTQYLCEEKKACSKPHTPLYFTTLFYLNVYFRTVLRKKPPEIGTLYIGMRKGHTHKGIMSITDDISAEFLFNFGSPFLLSMTTQNIYHPNYDELAGSFQFFQVYYHKEGKKYPLLANPENFEGSMIYQSDVPLTLQRKVQDMFHHIYVSMRSASKGDLFPTFGSTLYEEDEKIQVHKERKEAFSSFVSPYYDKE